MERVIKLLRELISEGEKILEATGGDSAAAVQRANIWGGRSCDLIEQTFSTDLAKGFTKSGAIPPGLMETKDQLKIHLKGKIEYLRCLSEDINKHHDYWIEKLSVNQMKRDGGKLDSVQIVTRMCKGFQRAAKRLGEGYRGREPFEISDEYDVQHLMHGLLEIFFDDVRREEWTPSYAGGTSRMDFLLKSEKIVLEIKKMRPGLSNKELGDQLIVDVDRYKEHPDCHTLMCLVYDPEGDVSSPRGFEKDLSGQKEKLQVKVVVTSA